MTPLRRLFRGICVPGDDGEARLNPLATLILTLPIGLLMWLGLWRAAVVVIGWLRHSP